MAIIAPEFLLGFAAEQYENAYNAVKDFTSLGYRVDHATCVLRRYGGFRTVPSR